MSELVALIKRHEGTGPLINGRMLPYTDTVGKLTIAWGRNLTDRGVSVDEATLLLENDVNDTVAALRHTYPWYEHLLPARQDALADMAFNLGMTKLAGFTRTLAALAQHDYPAAAAHMLDSTWAAQVGSRAQDLARMVETGGYL